MKTNNALYYITQISHQLNQEYTDKTLCNQYAWWLLQKLCNKNNAELIVQDILILDDHQQQQLNEWLTDLIINKKPIQYILGSVPFNDLDILVEPPTLIPRPETEEWCFQLIEQLKQLPPTPITIVDLATGSGCIALTLAYHVPHAHIVATDIADTALALAHKNAVHNNIKNVTFIKSDVYAGLPATAQFDLIVANPPYIAESERSVMDETVLNWEDQHALFADDNGLHIIKKIIADAPRFITQNNAMHTSNIPQVIIEIGWQQGAIVKQLMLAAGYNEVYIHKDLEKKDRLVVGRVDYVANTNAGT